MAQHVALQVVTITYMQLLVSLRLLSSPAHAHEESCKTTLPNKKPAQAMMYRLGRAGQQGLVPGMAGAGGR
jgi:hypothetical protein